MVKIKRVKKTEKEKHEKLKLLLTESKLYGRIALEIKEKGIRENDESTDGAGDRRKGRNARGAYESPNRVLQQVLAIIEHLAALVDLY